MLDIEKNKKKNGKNIGLTAAFPIMYNMAIKKTEDIHMKKIVSVLLVLALALAVSSAALAEMMVGGWEVAEHQPVLMMDEEMQAVFDKATGDMDGAVYVPVALLGTQVVAGINYCFLCQITPVVPDPKPVWALVYIYADLEGNAEITNIYEIYFDRHATPAE